MMTRTPERYSFIYHVIPHPAHNRRTSLLSGRFLFGYFVFLLLTFVAIRTVALTAPEVLGYASDINITDLLVETNKTREKYGLSPLRYSETLEIAAQNKAQDMFLNDYWAHISPKGARPWDFILEQGYDYEYAGENLAKNFDTSVEVVNAWYQSPSHRENLMSKNYSEVGFAVVNGTLGGYNTTLVVQMFGHIKGGVRDIQIVGADQNTSSLKPAVFQATTESSDVSKTTVSTKPSALPVDNSGVLLAGTSLPEISIVHVTKLIVYAFITFLIALLSADFWYSRKKGRVHITGNTLAHLLFLVFVIFMISMALGPGAVL